nr:hypothetical protein [Glaciecola punicea]
MTNVFTDVITLGQPMGAAAAMLFSALLDELEKRSLKRGLIALCLDGGQGIATIIILNNVYI